MVHTLYVLVSLLIGLSSSAPRPGVCLKSDTLDARPPAQVYRNDRFGYELVVPAGWERLPNDSTKGAPAFDVRVIHPARSVLAALYGIDGPRTTDYAVFQEMHRYLLDKQRAQQLLLIDGPTPIECAGRRGAVWELLNLGDALVWRVIILPAEAGGTSSVYVTIIGVTDPERAEQLAPTLSVLLRGLRFVPRSRR